MQNHEQPDRMSAGGDTAAPGSAADDPELTRVVQEEEGCLARVLQHLASRAQRPSKPSPIDYDRAMLELRDEIASARLEDVPPLIEQMERLQVLASRQRQAPVTSAVDARSPYFGRLVLLESGRQREVLIGRGTYLDPDAGVRIVDWRDAPVSRLYYRYEEGDDYDEVFGDREIEGEVLTRRSVTIVDGELRRVATPHGHFARSPAGVWRRIDLDATRLQGGQGSASRANRHHQPGQLGVGHGEEREDRHLREITPLIDRQQFDLITRPDSGLVVIQGGAGSGKTTIGLHRLAYLAYQDPHRFRADRTLVVVFNDALARYISLVLPALEVKDVAIRTYLRWAERLRQSHFPLLPARYRDDTPSEVGRLKKHPVMLVAIDAHVARLETRLYERMRAALRKGTVPATPSAEKRLESAWRSTHGRPLVHRIHALSHQVDRTLAPALGTDARVTLERDLRAALREATDVVGAWSELLSDPDALGGVVQQSAPGEFSATELGRALRYCSTQCSAVVEYAEEAEERAAEPPPRRGRRVRQEESDASASLARGVDGKDLDDLPALDLEDDTLLLRLHQKLRGPLLRGRKGQEALVYEHVFIDEAQDLSPLELAVVLGTVSGGRSVTLAGDVSQRLLMDNGFTDWRQVLSQLGLSHVAVEPLRLSYRSTQEIIDFARTVLGPLADEEECRATRHGAPVELFSFAHAGEAAGFLAEALRTLLQREPLASVAVIARYPEQADIYFDGLVKGEVPNLRRIADQDFPFRPGVDVTDVRQVKGLEFDYVVLVEASEAAYPPNSEASHLLHIAATRAAHQLWVMTTGRPSPLLPDDLLDRGY
jgi:DNA helicase-2/ATP-dependent DNA helicase PcrA